METLESILTQVEILIRNWQIELQALEKYVPEPSKNPVTIVLGGSLVSGLFLLDLADAIDVDVRFLCNNPTDEATQARIATVTGLFYRKTITVNDWPEGDSVGVMMEGNILLPDVTLPLEIEGCIRNTQYVGWAKFYRQVLTAHEIEEFRTQKMLLRNDKVAYKLLKKTMLNEVIKRSVARQLVKR